MPPRFEASAKSFLKAAYLKARAFALGTAGLLIPRPEGVPDLRDLKNILFIRIDRIGDMVLSTPAFRAIKRALPTVRLTVMASQGNAPILKHHPDIDEVLVYGRSAGRPGEEKIIESLRRRHFDLVIDPCTGYEMKTAWLAAMCGATHRIGYAAFGREYFFNWPVPMIDENRHFVESALALLAAIGIPAEDRTPAIYLGEDEVAWVRQWLKDKGYQSKPLVAIHPGAYYETQRWLPEYYAELIHLIRKETSLEVVLLGGPSDASIIDDIKKRAKNDICAFIQDDLRKFLAVLSECKVLVCNNTGPLHCAVALSIPTVSFMGPTVKEQWMPVGAIHRVLRRDDLPCIGCNLGYCKIKKHDCMRLILPRSVIDIILKMNVAG